MTGARKNSLFVLDDGETYAGEGHEIRVTDEELARIVNGEKIYEVIPDWDDPNRDVPEGVPTEAALEPRSSFEYVLNNDHVNNRVWITVNEPDGSGKADIGILINHDGVSIDVYPFQADEAVLQPYVLWGDIREAEKDED